MALEVVKVCGMTRLEDAQLAAELGATAVGFVFYPRSPRRVASAEAARISRALPPQVLRAGVFVNEAAETIARIADGCGLNVAQLHGAETADDIRRLRALAPELAIWKALPVNAEFDAPRWEDYGADAFLLDTASAGLYGGTGRSFPWSVAREAARQVRILIAGGLDAENVSEAVREAAPWGVDASSKLEASPGIKDHARLRAFLAAAKSLK